MSGKKANLSCLITSVMMFICLHGHVFIHAQEKTHTPIPSSTLQSHDTKKEEAPAKVMEDLNFDPYHQNEKQSPKEKLDQYEPYYRKVELFDFDPSQGLTFYISPNEQECFYFDVKFLGDEISGAYIVSSADSRIDLLVNNPEGATMYRRLGDAEGQYQVLPTIVGVHELCFVNPDSEGKLLTHVTNTLQSQHPVEKQHVTILSKYTSHLDIRFGELESEQRLHQLRVDRHIKIEESTSRRVSLYNTLECIVYLMICFFQVFYIKNLLENPNRNYRSWA